MKIVQLEEILFVRHSVFVVGDAGTGKTQTWRTLFRTYQNLKKKPVYADLNPKVDFPNNHHYQEYAKPNVWGPVTNNVWGPVTNPCFAIIIALFDSDC